MLGFEISYVVGDGFVRKRFDRDPEIFLNARQIFFRETLFHPQCSKIQYFVENLFIDT